jgi:PIN domain nuclease of toxin-antitoxin system
MKYLLDTHIWLWLIHEPEKLRVECTDVMSRADSQLFLSVASAWEVGIKFAMGKLALPEDPETFIPARLSRDRITALSIETSHALKAAALPQLHKDPFDRLLVAQAQSLGLILVTRDSWVQQYAVESMEG